MLRGPGSHVAVEKKNQKQHKDNLEARHPCKTSGGGGYEGAGSGLGWEVVK